jgi:hypothetical protein
MSRSWLQQESTRSECEDVQYRCARLAWCDTYRVVFGNAFASVVVHLSTEVGTRVPVEPIGQATRKAVGDEKP